MSGFVKKAKKKTGRLINSLRPGSRPTSPTRSTDPVLPAPTSGRHTYADPPKSPTAVATAGSIIYQLLVVARDGSDLCLPLKAALVGVVKIWDVCERTAEVKDEYEKLESRLAHLYALTQAYGKRSHLDANLKLRLDNIASSFEQLAACVESKLERGTARRILESQADIGEVKDILLKISTRIEAFIYESMIRIEIGVDAILARLPKIEENELQKDLERWRATAQVITSRSQRVHEAAHETQPKDSGCMPGTRVSLLDKFMTWVKLDPKRIFWLAGLAGTGKTSVAVTLCRMLERDSDVLLGGAFFCSRTTNVEARTDVRRIIPTLSAALADKSPRFAADLVAELKPYSGAAANKPVGDQIDPLLQRPLAALAEDKRPIVFVIDALDELSNERELAELLSAIARFSCDANVKFILTSRPETQILGSPISDRGQNEILQLHMIDTAEVTEDIRLYIEDAFFKSPLATPWYSDQDVTNLAELSNGLFIFASTIVSYVLDAKSIHSRTNRLERALVAVTKSAVAMGPLDAVYEFVLTRASNVAKVEPEELEATQRVLACILAARVPLSVTMLAELLGMDGDFLRESLQRILAIIYVPDEDDQPGLRTLHASFGDYLFGRAPRNIRISVALGHDVLARSCLGRMAWDDLCFNVSHSRSSYETNGLTTVHKIAPSLVYACLQWAHHIAAASDPSMLSTHIEQTFIPKFLFWLEVLSVLGKVGVASGLLRISESAIQRDDLSRFLRDANSFVASSREAIERSAPHIYLSALPLAAKDALIYQTFTPRCTGLVSVETFGIDRHGGLLFMTLTGHQESVRSVAYSPNDLRIASGSDDGTVRIWDTRTGEEAMPPLSSGDNQVNSIAFAPDGTSIAAGTDNGVCIWTDLGSQPTALRLSGQSSVVLSVTFSPDASIVAAGSEDKTVHLWRTLNGQNIPLSGHVSGVNAVSFSSDGQTLASGSGDQTIRLWRPETGDSVGQPLTGHQSSVLSVCFSPDDTMLASGSGDSTIILWEPRTGCSIVTLRGHSHWVWSVQFSPDGRSLLSASSDKNIRLWTLPDDVGEASSIILPGHSGWVHCVRFSPDGHHIASGSSDRTIRIWEAASGRHAVQPLLAHNGGVTSLAASPDGVFIVSGSRDCSVCVWSSDSGERRLAPLLGHTNEVLSVAVSSDGRLIASASEDRTIRIWTAATGELVGEPLQGHENAVNAIVFSSDAGSLASGSSDMTARIWFPATGKQYVAKILVCCDPVNAVAFSPDGLLLATGDDGGHIRLWQAATGQPVREPLQTDHSISSIDFSPTGTHIVSAGFSKTRVWDIVEGQQTLVLDGHTGWVHSARFSPNGQLICTASSDQTLLLWNAETGDPIVTLRGHGEAVRSAIFTSDGQSIVSCADNETIRVWDVKGTCSLLLDTKHDPISVLLSTRFTRTRGWVLGRSGELLLWVPEEYRAYLQVPPCMVLIGLRRVVIAVEAGGFYRGESWTSCWSKDKSAAISSTT